MTAHKTSIRDRKLDGILWNWYPVAEALPGAAGVTDLDGIIERKGHFLVFETKRPGEKLMLGQRLMLRELVRIPSPSPIAKFQVFILRGDHTIGHTESIQRVAPDGTLVATNWTIGDLAAYARGWWNDIDNLGD